MATETAERATTRNTIQRALVWRRCSRCITIRPRPTCTRWCASAIQHLARDGVPQPWGAGEPGRGAARGGSQRRRPLRFPQQAALPCEVPRVRRRVRHRHAYQHDIASYVSDATASPSSTTRSSSTAYARSARRRGSPLACSPAMPSALSSARFFLGCWTPVDRPVLHADPAEGEARGFSDGASSHMHAFVNRSQANRVVLVVKSVHARILTARSCSSAEIGIIVRVR